MISGVFGLGFGVVGFLVVDWFGLGVNALISRSVAGCCDIDSACASDLLLSLRLVVGLW